MIVLTIYDDDSDDDDSDSDDDLYLHGFAAVVVMIPREVCFITKVIIIIIHTMNSAIIHTMNSAYISASHDLL